MYTALYGVSGRVCIIWGEEIMQIKYGLISCDSHAQPHKDAFTSRMSKAKWGDAIPISRRPRTRRTWPWPWTIPWSAG